MKPVNFKILDYQYLNTGGNTMVGIFTVWLPEELKTVYALTNEEGCTLSVVDYISNELDPVEHGLDYDELAIDICDFGRLTGHEKYFELYRHCLNEYTASDCKYFGCTRLISYHLLSDELKKAISPEYFKWCVDNEYELMFYTDGHKIIPHPDYEEPTTEEDTQLRHVKHWRAWHDSLVGFDTTDEKLEQLYNKNYHLSLNGRRVLIPFNADTFSQINSLLDRVIEEW